MHPHWTAYLTALMTPVVAFIALGIAYRQWRTAQSKLKLDLFERRHAILDATRAFIKSSLTSKSDEGLNLEYLRDMRTAKWFFGPEIPDYLENVVWSKAVDLDILRQEKDGTTGQERVQLAEKVARAKGTLMDELVRVDDKFSPYLKLNH